MGAHGNYYCKILWSQKIKKSMKATGRDWWLFYMCYYLLWSFSKAS